MPFIVTRSDAPSKMFAQQQAEPDVWFWVSRRDKATPMTSEAADSFVEEFAKYSDIDLDIEGVRAAPIAEPAPLEVAA